MTSRAEGALPDQPPDTGGHSWTPARQELQAWLERNAPSLAELYEAAVRMAHDDTYPGRVRLVAHAVREIANRLPDVLSGKTSGGRIDYTGRVGQIASIWQKFGYPEDGALHSASLSPDGSAPSSDIPLPRDIVLQFAGLVRDHLAAREKPKDAAFRLFEACAPENRESRETLGPVIGFWMEQREWFVSRAHDPGHPARASDSVELRGRFEIFETTLSVLVGTFFRTMEEIDEVLEDTNA